MADITPTLLRRRLGAALKTLRVRSGLNLADGAKLLGVSSPTLSKVENGRQRTDPERFFTAYGVTDAERVEEVREIAKLADSSRHQSLYVQYKDVISDRFADFLEMEQIATGIDLYGALLIPGVLQTVEYASAAIGGISVLRTAREARASTELRMKRQEVLTSSSLALRCVLDEASLRRELGGPSVLRQQLEHLLTVSRQPNVELQVIPFKAGMHTGLDGAYTVFHFEVGSPVVAVEPLTTSHYLEEDDQVARYDVAFDRLRTQALDPEASRDFIARIAEETQ
ncbi:helix-turn-helix domain-containing protein [Streptomyces albireticuli]|uniref:Transcriptional regulator n=1 Tax=Streptomyces albireticuli TaxID=1940 RepID=A0A2A2D3J2_9ACTN|nr:helix-turn-helix transcriptional regulator [Streptomyces albireticuli]MCD9142882.1 helix-turn-helix domain-containing protein [Streptomyces albireticuli]MCD9162799.1 helix-turn-helix domain-containing protein [Streptomyces albireticuli]MCD9192359.1 helix-turn-helix domain-containing protein [Streptomyces albireticuli]PAU45900.1 transcriptional regulator [Streptomyces albireticuli]